MITTEEEAKTKWCPHGRVFDANGANRWMHDGIARGPLCIGQNCMAWRWGGQHETKRNDLEVAELHIDRIGYCGLAGQPDDRPE